jgi:hypothetical protein
MLDERNPILSLSIHTNTRLPVRLLVPSVEKEGIVLVAVLEDVVDDRTDPPEGWTSSGPPAEASLCQRV